MTGRVTHEDLALAQRDGWTIADLATELGVAYDTVRMAERRAGYRLSRPVDRAALATGYDGIAAAARQLSEPERSVYLLDCVRELSGASMDADEGALTEWLCARCPPKARAAMRLLVRYEGRVVSRDALMRAVYPLDLPAGAREAISTVMCHLRRELPDEGLTLRTIWGMGYQLERAPGAAFPWEAPESSCAAH